MLTTGIILGLVAAVCQSLSYLPSRWYVLSRPNSLTQLLALSHVMQGVACLPLLWWFWPDDMPPVSQFATPLVAETVFYFIGQSGLFLALRHTDASRVSPLLGVKVVLIALLTVAFMGQSLSTWQWLAAVLATAAAYVLNKSGGAIPLKAMMGMAVAWVGYSLSDFFIGVYIRAMHPMDPLQAGLLGMYMTYLMCGFIGLAMLPWYGSRRWRDWRDASPYAFFWFVSMVMFYGSLATAGLVLAAILQSTRSFWSLAIGAVIAHFGYHALEQRVSAGVLLRRTLGAAMMVAAIILYVLPHQTASDADTTGQTPAMEGQIDHGVDRRPDHGPAIVPGDAPALPAPADAASLPGE